MYKKSSLKLVPLHDIEKMFKDILSALRSANRMTSDEWRIIALKQAIKDLKNLISELEKSIGEAEDDGSP